MFSIASMTKPITATALMILQDEGKLSVDDPVSKYLPEFGKVRLHNGQPPHRPLTIRDLMTHTSGLSGSQQNHGSLKETVEQIATRPLDFQPGTKWQYGPGMSVCGRIIEVVSGQPYDQFLQQHVFDPLRMVDTTFFPSAEQKKRLAQLYKPGEAEDSIVPATSWISALSDHRTPNPSAGLFSTASDLAQFYQMILAGGQLHGQRIISPEAIEQMRSVQTGELTTGFTPGNGWGLGWCVVAKPQGVTAMLSPGTYGHGGAFGTQGWIDPTRKMIFVLMIQRTGFPNNSDRSDIRSEFQQSAVDATTATDSPMPPFRDRVLYAPGHFGNSYEVMGRNEMRELLAEARRWGFNRYADWFDKIDCSDLFSSHGSTHVQLAQALWQRKKANFLSAQSLGLKCDLVLTPNHVYVDQCLPGRLAKKGSRVFGQLICPSIPEARAIILKNYDNLFADLAKSGVQLSAICPCPYDS